MLSFGVSDPGSYGGFLFHNRFLFRKGLLDTSATSTHWGVYFAPLPLPLTAINDAECVTLRTTVVDPSRPSSFTLQAEAAGTVSVVQSF